MNQIKNKNETIAKQLNEMRPNPAINRVSAQIANQDVQRRTMPIHERLYAKGKEKIRSQAVQSAMSQRQPDFAPSNKLVGTGQIHEGLHNLHHQRMVVNQHAEQQEIEDFKERANTRYRLKTSEDYIIESFKRKFRLELMELKNIEVIGGQIPLQDIDPQEHSLDYE